MKLGNQTPTQYLEDQGLWGPRTLAAHGVWVSPSDMKLRATVFQDPDAYFHRYAGLSDVEALETAHTIWREINGRNLRENILTTRARAQLVLVKGPQHRVHSVHLRRV